MALQIHVNILGKAEVFVHITCFSAEKHCLHSAGQLLNNKHSQAKSSEHHAHSKPVVVSMPGWA